MIISDIKYKEISVDKRIGEALDYTFSRHSTQQIHSKQRLFCELFCSKKISDVDWISLCDDADTYESWWIALSLIVQLLKKDLYKGSYSKELHKRLKMLDYCTNSFSKNYPLILCKEKISRLILYKRRCSRGSISIAIINGENDYIIKELTHYLNINSTPNWFMENLSHFEYSLQNYSKTILNHKDFDSTTLFCQISYFKELYSNDTQKRKQSISGILSFYRYIVNQYPDCDIFESSFQMHKRLLFAANLSTLIENNYTFVPLISSAKLNDEDKVVFLIRGYDSISTRLSSEDFTPINISKIKTPEYRQLVWEYLLANPSLIINPTQITYIAEYLHLIELLKNIHNYQNSNLFLFSNIEGAVIRDFVTNDNKTKISTQNNKIGAIRRFFLFHQQTRKMAFADFFFDYLKQIEEPTWENGQALSDREIEDITKLFIKKAKLNLYNKEMFVIFLLLLLTEFRVNQICHLKCDCIRPSFKPNQYHIHSISKTTHGKKEDYAISEYTYKLLLAIIDQTEELRIACNIDTYKNYIFLYRTKMKSISVITPSVFNGYFQNICFELNLPCSYNTSNLRDTHMTKAFEHILRTGKSEIEMGLLSKHTRIDTTKSHYIQIELEKMLEATYGLIIGEEYIDAYSKIMDKIPPELQGKDSDVADGCGKCSQPSCIFLSPLPCLICKEFKTTIEHEKYFVKAIHKLDEVIQNTTNKHDKEDLILIKKLHVIYLKAILLYKENNHVSK